MTAVLTVLRAVVAILKQQRYLGGPLRAGLREMPKVKIYSPEDNAMGAGFTVYGVYGVTGPQRAAPAFATRPTFSTTPPKSTKRWK
jgi:selenocysteine lyase/cysteine desulfurase